MGLAIWGWVAVFLSTIERQLDSKRRIVLPVDFRAAAAGPFDGVFCFPSIEADCIEGGGQALFDSYKAVIDDLPVGDPLRAALRTSVMGGMAKLSWDPAGRITLPEGLCEMFGLSDWVSVVGLGESFQIWSRETFAAHRDRQRLLAREGLVAYSAEKRLAKAAGS